MSCRTQCYPSEAKVRVLLTVKGEVQGVSFRKQTLNRALELKVTGWVKNLEDGSVQGCLEGAVGDVEALRDWCSRGPARARVYAMESIVQTYAGEFDGFSIL
jgi:acylphosphatase